MYKSKFLYAMALGLLGFVASFFSVKFTHGDFNIYLQWGFLMPLFASMAYGPKYGLISGLFGLGALFPFFIFKNNGYANLITSGFFLAWFLYQGYFYSLREKKRSFWNRPVVVFIPFIVINFLAYVYLFPLAFSLNPPFWAKSALTQMPNSVLMSIAYKDVVLKLTGLLMAMVAIKLPWVRRFFQLKTNKAYQKNANITGLAYGGMLGLWLLWLFFNRLFMRQVYTNGFFKIESLYEWLGLFVCVVAGTIVAVIAIHICEAQFLVKEKLNVVSTQIKSISSQFKEGMVYQIHTLPSGEKKFTFVSDSVKRLYGYSPEEVYADPTLLYTCIHPDCYEGFIREERNAINQHQAFVYEARMLDRFGNERWSHFTASPDIQEEGDIYWNALETVITSQKERELYIEKISQTDALTGLFNRRYFDAIWAKLVEESLTPIGFIMADVNGLKLVNDAFGHAKGDALLKAVSSVIQNSIGSEDIAFRFGGDEFMILAPKSDAQKIEALIDTLKIALSQVVFDAFETSVSFGYGIKANRSDHLSDVLRIADEMMYAHKTIESEEMRLNTIEKIMNTLFEASIEEKAHSEQVMAVSQKIGEKMQLPKEQLEVLKTSAKFHDIGKIGVKAYLLNKEGGLSRTERHEVQRHSEVGYHLLKGTQAYQASAVVVLHHHEWFDGSGYPKGLSGDDIPLLSRIVAIADAYHAFILREKSQENTLKKACEEIKRFAGSQFDPEIVSFFLSCIQKH